jgi:hypothetical protein
MNYQDLIKEPFVTMAYLCLHNMLPLPCRALCKVQENANYTLSALDKGHTMANVEAEPYGSSSRLEQLAIMVTEEAIIGSD